MADKESRMFMINLTSILNFLTAISQLLGSEQNGELASIIELLSSFG